MTGFSPAQKPETSVSTHIAQTVRRRKFGPRVWIEHFLLLALLCGFAATGFIPAWRHLNSDFPNYYLVARLYRAGYPLDRVYEWTWLQRQKDHQGIDQGLVSFIPLTLPSAVAVMPWSSLPPLEAKRQWLLVNLVFLVLIHIMLTRITTLGWERVALLMFLAFIPLRDNFLLGQMHVFVLLLLTLAAWLYFRESHFLAGISLAIAAALKIYPALFLIFFVWKKQWRAAIGLVVGLSSVAVLSIRLFGRDACVLYAREVLPAGLRGDTIDPYNTAWNSWTALLRRLFIAEPELNPSPLAHLPWLYAFLQPLIHGSIFVVFMWALSSQKKEGERTKIEWATFLFLLLFLSSQPAPYHFVALVLTTVLLADYLVAHRRPMVGCFALLTYSLICGPIIRFPGILPTGWHSLLFFSRLVFMAVFGGLLLWMLVRPSTELESHFKSRSAALAISALIVLTVFGFISTEKHLKGQFENYKSRVSNTPEDLFASNPVLSSEGILFTGMTQAGYTIRRLQGGTVISVPGIAGDLFHATVSQVTNLNWAEQSSRGGSRIVQFTIGAPGSKSTMKPEVEDAQEPVVSRDGQFLGFLRAVNGRNSLWVRTISVTAGKKEAAEAHEIAGTEYDVREMSFTPDNRLIFSSKRSGEFSLYMATLSGEIEGLRGPTCPARFPVASPNGQWLAFTCDQRGSWQLRVMDFKGKAQLQLTSGDCNSISPTWTGDSKRLVYATDCGRGLGLTALAEVKVSH